MTGLSEYFYNIGGGVTKHDEIELEGDYDVVLTPSTGKKLVLMGLVISDHTTGDNAKVSVRFYAGEVASTVVLTSMRFGVSMPIQLDFSACPWIGAADETLQAKTVASGSTVYVEAYGYEID